MDLLGAQPPLNLHYISMILSALGHGKARTNLFSNSTQKAILMEFFDHLYFKQIFFIFRYGTWVDTHSTISPHSKNHQSCDPYISTATRRFLILPDTPSDHLSRKDFRHKLYKTPIIVMECLLPHHTITARNLHDLHDQLLDLALIHGPLRLYINLTNIIISN